MSVYQEESDSTFTHDGVEYDLNGILRSLEKIPIQKIAVRDIWWVLEYTEVDEKRVEAADIKIPVLIAPDKIGRPTAVDGAHRLTKAVRLRFKTIPAKWITKTVLKHNIIEK